MTDLAGHSRWTSHQNHFCRHCKWILRGCSRHRLNSSPMLITTNQLTGTLFEGKPSTRVCAETSGFEVNSSILQLRCSTMILPPSMLTLPSLAHPISGSENRAAFHVTQWQDWAVKALKESKQRCLGFLSEAGWGSGAQRVRPQECLKRCYISYEIQLCVLLPSGEKK